MGVVIFTALFLPRTVKRFEIKVSGEDAVPGSCSEDDESDLVAMADVRSERVPKIYQWKRFGKSVCGHKKNPQKLAKSVVSPYACLQRVLHTATV